MVLLALACANDPCPTGWTHDAPRTAHLEALLQRPISATLCWGDVPDRGLRDTRGRFLLDSATDDRLLAARIVHLEHHRAPASGPGCEDRLRVEEANAWAAELRQHGLLGVSDPSGPARRALGESPTLSDLMEWLTTSDDPVPTQLRASHRARCEGGSVPPEAR
ncbi:MAG: hypothetical protein R3F61_37015 [Myxococcota bacterium]